VGPSWALLRSQLFATLSKSNLNGHCTGAQELEAALEAAREQLAAAQAQAAPDISCLTPRPQWDELLSAAADADCDAGSGSMSSGSSGSGAKGSSTPDTASTAARVKRLLAAHARERRQARDALPLASALAGPEPPPAMWTLSVSVEACPYFLTEGATLLPPPTAPPREFAAPLGITPDVPRFLRLPTSNSPLLLKPMARKEVEAAVAAVWRAKAAHDALHGGHASDLHAFLHEQLMQLHAGDAAAAVQEGYSLYHAAMQLHDAHGSAAARLFVKILTGQLPEGVLWEQQRLLKALVRMLLGLQQAVGVGLSTSVSIDELSAALRFLLPFQPPEQVAALQQQLHLLAPADGRWDLHALTHAAEARLLFVKSEQQAAEADASQADADEAASAVLEELLSHEVEAIEQHTQAALQRVRQLLLHRAGVGESSAVTGGVWDVVLHALGGGSEGGAAAAGGASGNQSMAAAAAAAGSSLLTAAAASRLRQQGSSRAMKLDSTSTSTSSMAPPGWLGFALTRVDAAGVEQLLAALQSSTLLLPPSCALDLAGALQWISLTCGAAPQPWALLTAAAADASTPSAAAVRASVAAEPAPQHPEAAD